MTQTAPAAIDVAGSSGLKRKGLCDYLIEFGKLSPANAERALRLQSEQDIREPIGAILVKLGYVTERNVAECLAAQLALPLVGGGDHDWNELFFRFGLLAEPSVERVSSLTFACGVALMFLGLAWCVYFVLPPAARTSVRDRLTDRWHWMEGAL